MNITFENCVLWLAIFAISCIYGFIYETIFYYFNDGEIIHRGSSFGPFIQIYGWGGLLIYFVCVNRFESLWSIALASGAVCGLLEYISGWVLWNVFGHLRAWNYNTEKWNWLNVDGFICLRSILVFAISGMILMKVALPIMSWLQIYIGSSTLNSILCILGLICAADIIYNSVLCRLFPLMTANEFWEKFGWHARVWDR